MADARRENLDFLERAPVRFSVERHLAASPERVFDAMADAPGWSKWFSIISRASWTSPVQGGVGSTRRVVMPGGIAVDEEFIAWDRPHRWGFQITGGNVAAFRAGVELAELEPAPDGGTNLRYSGGLELAPALRFMKLPMSLTVGTLIGRAFGKLDAQLARGA